MQKNARWTRDSVRKACLSISSNTVRVDAEINVVGGGAIAWAQALSAPREAGEPCRHQCRQVFQLYERDKIYKKFHCQSSFGAQACFNVAASALPQSEALIARSIATDRSFVRIKPTLPHPRSLAP